MNYKRRQLLCSLILAPMVVGSHNLWARSLKEAHSSSRLQYSINAYSFNSLLRSGGMTFFDFMDFAAALGLDAVDLTGYYFPEYPEIPEDKFLFQLKKNALQLGLNISWTGVRNNFVTPNKTLRGSDVELIRKWLEVSSKLGASIMRVFPGNGKHERYSRDEVKKWMVSEFQKWAQYAKETGVVLGLQHYDDFCTKPMR